VHFVASSARPRRRPATHPQGHRYDVPWDLASFVIVLVNVAVVAAGGLLRHLTAPVVFLQTCTVALAILASWVFSRLPEWTGWSVLGAMALWDIYAVLHQKGPLGRLVDAATAPGGVGLPPGLVYEVRNRGQHIRPRGTPGPAAQSSSITPLPSTPRGVHVDTVPAGGPLAERHNDDLDDDPEDSESESRVLKLGLGDFVFYSTLAALAARYDLATVLAAVLGVFSGLVLTLAALAAGRRTLPALPMSILLGALFYFGARFALEPVAAQILSRGVLFG